ncbi:hypothetical protein MTO96_015280 [Rhipicephalus appendiculatus]
MASQGLGGLQSRWFNGLSFGGPWMAALVLGGLACAALAGLVGLLTSGQSLGTIGLAGLGMISLWDNTQTPSLLGLSLLDTRGTARLGLGRAGLAGLWLDSLVGPQTAGLGLSGLVAVGLADLNGPEDWRPYCPGFEFRSLIPMFFLVRAVPLSKATCVAVLFGGRHG